MTDEQMIEQIAEVIHDYLDERFPGGAMPGGQQVFADDHLDAEFKHEAGCDELARRVHSLMAAKVAELVRLFPEAFDVLTRQEMRDAKGNWRSLIDQQTKALAELRAALAPHPEGTDQ